MNLTSLVTDNITEVLVKIIEFTQRRQKILIGNLTNMGKAGFVPQELAVHEFSELLAGAIDEHIENERLLLYDTEHIKFGANGHFEVEVTADRESKSLLETNRDEYLEVQTAKLLENSLNQRIAAELLRQRQHSFSSDS
jgi:flagellar basal body rod protein FlgB